MSLLKEVSSLQQLGRAWSAIKKNKQVTAGIDRETVELFDNNARANLIAIAKLLRSKSYKFSQVVERSIPKHPHSHKTRNIRIFTLKDKIVQKSIQLSLEKDSDKKYFPEINNSVSVGFLKKVAGVKTAVSRIKKYYKEGYKILTSADIANFFDVIDRSKLKKIIISRLAPDTSITWLLDQCLSPVVIKTDRNFGIKAFLIDTHAGVSQGSILSPLFSNIYLMKFDNVLGKTGIVAIRYADDLAILSKDEVAAKVELMKVQEILKKESGLKFHPMGSQKRPKIYNLKDYGIFLGIKFQITKNGVWKITPSIKKYKEIEVKITEEMKPSTQYPLYVRLNNLNYSIRSWFLGYKSVGCTKRDLSIMYKQLCDVFQKNMNTLLIKKGIIQKPLSFDKLRFIGILSLKRLYQ